MSHLATGAAERAKRVGPIVATRGAVDQRGTRAKGGNMKGSAWDGPLEGLHSYPDGL